MCVVTVTDSRLKTTPGGSRLGTDRSSATGGVRLAAASTMRRHRTESWSYKTERTAEEQKCFEPTQRRKESVNLINALKLLANQQKDGDGPVKMVVQGTQDEA